MARTKTNLQIGKQDPTSLLSMLHVYFDNLKYMNIIQETQMTTEIPKVDIHLSKIALDIDCLQYITTVL